MQVSRISNSNPNFGAKFVYDSKNNLRKMMGSISSAGVTESNYKESIKLLKKFKKIGKGQELEIELVEHRGGNFKMFQIFNRSNGKDILYYAAKGKDSLLNIIDYLVNDSYGQSIFKPDSAMNKFFKVLLK